MNMDEATAETEETSPAASDLDPDRYSYRPRSLQDRHMSWRPSFRHGDSSRDLHYRCSSSSRYGYQGSRQHVDRPGYSSGWPEYYPYYGESQTHPPYASHGGYDQAPWWEENGPSFQPQEQEEGNGPSSRLLYHQPPPPFWPNQTYAEEQSFPTRSASIHGDDPMQDSTETPTRSNRQRHQKSRASRRLEWEHRNNPTSPDAPTETFKEKRGRGRGRDSLIVVPPSAEKLPEYAIDSNREAEGANQDVSFTVDQYDVLCGRGVAPSIAGHGNEHFKKLVKRDQLEYISCRRNEKPPIAITIINDIRAHGGRFLRRVRATRHGKRGKWGWTELAENRVYEKVCQALRDGAPQIRQRMIELDNKEKNTDKENSVNRNVTNGWT